MSEATVMAKARGRLSALAGLAWMVAAGIGLAAAGASAEPARALPPPAIDQATIDQNASAEATSAVAVLAGGCFWGVQGVFQHVDGVSNAVSGYAGGTRETARYELIGTGRTGHAEAVRITYDPRRISYGRLLQIYFSVAHDPTEVDRQGPDEGPQYRSAIFPESAEQARIAAAYIAQLDATGILGAPIATKIEQYRPFYAAEDYHQDFMTKNPRHPYIVEHDLPKVDWLKRQFPDLYRDQPTLVAGQPRTN
ncbi:peptide-methionine (S)-S-oxide reductase [Stella humosa]|uniref:Peptide methionine sulfoxide reductase MsrA n=1 Tax=Stella humosa TaxID=94 RepID=A0A3N1M9J4_9PROT|nr:peptide-methionine (S)-S-oxide reductase MsrA [Stella humosa]ROQ00353.1 peptide-methionine (S)-S-oxide reductase [Stella humosa]BBK30408.1 peptide methionine sulfoxide reductase MsrA [Stella humosa]